MGLGYPPTPATAASCANHPDRPAEALCSRCGDFVCGQCHRLGPTGDIFCTRCAENVTIREPLPWERRHELGVVEAYLQTMRGILFSPLETLKRIEPHGSYGDAIWFLLIYAVAVGIGISAQTVAQFMALSNTPGFSRAETNPLFANSGAPLAIMVVGLLVVMPLFTLLGTFINAGMLHLAGMVVGAASNGYRATFRMLAYVGGLQMGVAALSLLTAIVGAWHMYAYLGISTLAQLVQLGLWVYMWVLWAFGLKEVHETTIGRGLGAVGAYFGGMILLCCGIYALTLLTILSAASL